MVGAGTCLCGRRCLLLARVFTWGVERCVSVGQSATVETFYRATYHPVPGCIGLPICENVAPELADSDGQTRIELHETCCLQHPSCTSSVALKLNEKQEL